MKNQYFGDTRDLFKYDLILRIVQGVDSIKRFLFIPMLTEDDSSKDGNKTDYGKAKAGKHNLELMEYLQECVREKRRDILQIENYFKSKNIEVSVARELFVHQNRRTYFDKVRMRTEFFSHSLVFVDPDNGLEVKKPKEKHILYDEVRDLYNSMDKNSVLMIYQHRCRVKLEQHLSKIICKLSKIAITRPTYISDNDIIFFFLAKNSELRDDIETIISNYRKEYPKLITETVQHSDGTGQLF